MNVSGYYDRVCREMYHIICGNRNKADIQLERIEEYIMAATHDPEFYLFAGMAEYKVLDGDKSVGEYNSALGGISLFEDLIGLDWDER